MIFFFSLKNPYTYPHIRICTSAWPSLRSYQRKGELFRNAAINYRIINTSLEQKLRAFRCLPEESKVDSYMRTCACMSAYLHAHTIPLFERTSNCDYKHRSSSSSSSYYYCAKVV